MGLSPNELATLNKPSYSMDWAIGAQVSMDEIYAKTQSLCPSCAMDAPAEYEERATGMWLHVDCPQDGRSSEKIAGDADFFKWGYEQKYEKPIGHLVIPVTYRCNLNCRYCYTLSNSSLALPPDWPASTLKEIFERESENITLLGGEPTLRPDLSDLIEAAKHTRSERKVSVGTNGQKLALHQYARQLKESGLDFVFLSLNDPHYEESTEIYSNKLQALDNCAELGLRVWLQRTIDNLDQLDSLLEVIQAYRRIIFHVTIRSVKPFGVRLPSRQVFVSEIISYLGKARAYTKGVSPFNRYLRLYGKPTKICSWVNDVSRVDPIDSDYLISTGLITKFHRGMKLDELRLTRAGTDGAHTIDQTMNARRIDAP